MPNVELLFLLPILGGYIFLTTFYLTKFQHSRIETQRLIFNSIIASIGLLLLSYYFDEIFLKNFFVCVREFGKSLIPFKVKNFNLFLFSLLFSFGFAKFLNWLLPRNILMWYVIYRWGNEFEKLYYESMNEEDYKKKLIMITTDSNKVYVGYILRISKPLLTQQIEIVPIVSGYRKSETKKVQFTTPYFSTYKKLSKELGFDFTEEETAVILPKEKIISVSKFYPIVYKEFQERIQLIENNQIEE